MTPTTLIDLFGTDAPQPDRRLLTAGQFSVVLEDGNLRDIRFGGIEVIRAVNYLARDTSWGTYAPVLSAMQIDQDAAHFNVMFHGLCAGPEGRFAYCLSIQGEASGLIRITATGEALTDFPTNRVGFVVLHPSEVAGGDLAVRHADGTRVATRFPKLIDPAPPVLDIAGLSHHPASGMTCHVDFTGDAFEMEDQRNWADASFKTFVRPLSKPRPYRLASGTVDVQTVTIRIEGFAHRAATRDEPEPFVIGGPIGRMPDIALFSDSPNCLNGQTETLGTGLTQMLVQRWRPGQGAALARADAFAQRIGAELAVEAILPARDPEAETQALLADLAALPRSPGTVLLAPEREFRTSPPGRLPVGEVTTDTLVRQLRAAGYPGRIGAGTPSFFPEFNRNPPGDQSDFVYFGGCGIVHAADDASVMETIGVYPAILATATARVGKAKPIWLGPCTIGARHTPYGSSLPVNPEGSRVPMSQTDPRHAALFGAAYAVGLAAQTADTAVDCLILAAPFGPFGLRTPLGRSTVMLPIHRLLAQVAGSTRLSVVTGNPALAALVWQDPAGDTVLLIANLSEHRQPFTLPDPVVTAEHVDHSAMTPLPAQGAYFIDAYRTQVLRFANG